MAAGSGEMTRCDAGHKGEVGCVDGFLSRADRDAEQRPDRILPWVWLLREGHTTRNGLSVSCKDLEAPATERSAFKAHKAGALSPLRRCRQLSGCPRLLPLSITAPSLEKFRSRFPRQCIDACKKHRDKIPSEHGREEGTRWRVSQTCKEAEERVPDRPCQSA
jgi:hypothetical protein